MGMGIDKTGKQDTLTGIDDFTVGIDQSLDFATASDGFDHAIAHQHRAVFDDRKLAQIAARASAFRARERDGL